jgi:hypothetical protein
MNLVLKSLRKFEKVGWLGCIGLVKFVFVCVCVCCVCGFVGCVGLICERDEFGFGNL